MSAMQALWLDYQRPLPGRHWPGLILLAAGLLLCGFLLMQSFSIGTQITVAEQQLSRLKRGIERQRIIAGTEMQAAGIGETVQSRASPSAARWEALLASLESAGDDSVTLLSIEPGAKEISISGEARDLGSALDYVKRLQKSAVFADVHLAKHQLLIENPYRPVLFTILAKWRGGLP